MQIFVKTLSGKILTLQVEGTDKVSVVKKQLEDQEKVPLSHQRLLFDGQELEDEKELSFYNISKESELKLTLKKDESSISKLSKREKEELDTAQSSKMQSFYNSSVGLNEELMKFKDTGAKFDAHANPEGEQFDLGRTGQFRDFNILIGRFDRHCGLKDAIEALRKKGFSIDVSENERDFIRRIKKTDHYAVAWIISSNVSMSQDLADEFVKAVMKFHKEGGGLMVWGDNDPYFAHANQLLPTLLNSKVKLIGDTPGGHSMSVGKADQKGQFAPHIITTGVIKLFEGVTICYPDQLGPLKVLATSGDNHPAVCYADNESLGSDSCGRIVVDCGWTKNYCSWQEAGTARYVSNATIWLLALEHRVVKSSVNVLDKLTIEDVRLKLLNMVCATLVNEPSYYSGTDTTKAVLTNVINHVALQDPEFILKIAYYVREDLNIRSTANYILALACNNAACHKFIPKYFNEIIKLPSDLLDTVTIFLNLPNKVPANPKSIPAILRNCVNAKFPEFDSFSLAKYNKERAQKKKSKRQQGKEPKTNFRNVRPGAQNEIVDEKPPMITLKQLIRKAHVSQPAVEIMSIIGKKYPANEEEFKKSEIPGEFDPSKAGKKMKLAVPETWETELSAKGNIYSTWESLIDHKKLPFMAMLRNIRNIIVTGVSPKHHQTILNRLTDETTIANSKQLPWRFLSAYEAINIDLEQLMNDILDNDGSGEKIIRVPIKGRKGRSGATREIKKKVIIPMNMPDIPLINQYREAIDTAIKFATMKNVPPIEGNTVVLVDVSKSMMDNLCPSKPNLQQLTSVRDIAILMGLMIQHASEQCEFRIFSSPLGTKDRGDIQVRLQENTILSNVERVAKEAEKLGEKKLFPFEYIRELIKKKEKIDNLIIISDMMIAPGNEELPENNVTVSSIIKEYRDKVNPDLLLVALDLYGNGNSIIDVNTTDPKNILVTGFSDNVLRFIAERGSQKQLERVMSMDKVVEEKAQQKKIRREKQEKKL